MIGKFKAAGVQVDALSAADVARIQDKVKPVVAKFTPVIGEEFVQGFYTEIEQARKAK